MIKHAKHEDQYKLLVKWLENDMITDQNGTMALEDFQFSARHKHHMIRRIWSSSNVSIQKKS